MLPGERMRATYEFQPVDRLPRGEFYIWDETMTRWKAEGLPDDWDAINELFHYDPPGKFGTGLGLGWCEPPFWPMFEDKLIEVQGDYELIQDVAGRICKNFRGRREGFMPIYLKHVASTRADWDAVKWRLDPGNQDRWKALAGQPTIQRQKADAVGGMVTQGLIGGYMYLRAMMGPEDLLLAVHDQPELIQSLMQAWLEIVDAGLAHVQAEIEIDEVFFAEDICYNHGLLISPQSVRGFLFPYYRQVLDNARARQSRFLHFQLDTDGDCRPAIPLYKEIGLTAMSPMEVASGCDVVEIAKEHPDLRIFGGIDKRVLAAGREAIDAHLEHILPFMVKRGGYYPMCDHGVPPDVSLENYLHYRERVCELDH